MGVWVLNVATPQAQLTKIGNEKQSLVPTFAVPCVHGTIVRPQRFQFCLCSTPTHST